MWDQVEVGHRVVERDVGWLDECVGDLELRRRGTTQGIEPSAELIYVAPLVGAREEEADRDLRRGEQVPEVLGREERQPTLAERALNGGPTQLFSHIANYLRWRSF